MNHARPLLLAGLGILGLVSGFVTGRAVNNNPLSAASSESADQSRKSSARAARGVHEDEKSTGASPATRSTVRSADTLEALLTLGDDALYGRLALWLMDAEEADIAAFWAHHMGKEKRNRDITDLLMIAWTRVNPQGAIAALAGTNDEHFAWWAWACHDPAAALQAAIDSSPNRIGNVAWGIGEFHPAWLRENFEKIPAAGRGNALQGLVKWGEVDDAMATLEFLKEHNRNPPVGLLEAMVRQDPWGAYEWFEKNGASLGTQYGSRDESMNRLSEALAESHPDVLARLIEQQPSGARKRQMETAAFDNLLDLDLDAALAQAESTAAPIVAAERLAAVGLRLARTDPERAFEVAERFFTENPDALQSVTQIVYPDGTSSRRGSSGGPNAFLDALMARNPQRVMELFANLPEDPEPAGVVAGGTGRGAVIGAVGGAVIGAQIGGSYTTSVHGDSLTSQIAGKWAGQDLEGFAEWVVAQDDPAVTNSSAPIIISSLQNQQRFEEAAEWVLGIDDPNGHQVRRLLRSWEQVDPEAARAWQEAADLEVPEEGGGGLQQSIESPR